MNASKNQSNSCEDKQLMGKEELLQEPRPQMLVTWSKAVVQEIEVDSLSQVKSWNFGISSTCATNM